MIALGKIIGDALGSSGANIIKSVGDVADKFITTKEEKAEFQEKVTSEINRHVESLASSELDETKAYLADTSNARDSNSRIQESEHSSWLAKNVAYMLDIVFTLGFLTMFILVLFKKVPIENKEIFYTGFGLLGGYVGTVLQFHRGSSISSQKNGETMRDIIKNK